MLEPSSRESGVEFACGGFLFALGVGLLIPRAGLGLYSIVQAGGHPILWAVSLIASSLGIMLASYFRRPGVRFAAVVASMACWTALAFRFVEASLWGATFQCVIALFLLNACAFRLFAYLRRIH